MAGAGKRGGIPGLEEVKEDRQEAFQARIFLAREVQSDDDINSLSQEQQRQRLQDAAAAINSIIDQLCTLPPPQGAGGYIWNRDAPCARIPAQSNAHSPTKSSVWPQLEVYARTGGALEDVHFATFLLREATKRLRSLGLAVSLSDEDGQFLLIEAADFLDDWVDPENAEGRVWIYDGRLHIVKPEAERKARLQGIGAKPDKGMGKATSAAAEQSQDDEDDIDQIEPLDYELGQAIIRDPSISTLASQDVETAAFEPISSFPTTAFNQSHKTLAFLPASVASVLHQSPQLIAAVAEALLTRDPLSARCASKMDKFLHGQTPVLPASLKSTSQSAQGSQVVLSSVKMTKRIYASLLTEHYLPPKVFGRDWQARVEKYYSTLFETRESQTEDADMNEDDKLIGRWLDLGAKIACGMEMLYQESRSKARGAARRINAMEPDPAENSGGTASAENPQVKRLIKSLKDMGYFGTELEGSSRWKQLEASAVQQWQLQQSSAAQDQGDASNNIADVSSQINQLLKTNEKPHDLFKTSVQDLQSEEDDTAWLAVGPDAVEEMRKGLESNATNAGNQEEDEAERFASEQLEAFSTKMEEFLKNEGDYAGARFSDEDFQDGESDEDSEDDSNQVSGDEKMADSETVEAQAKAKAKSQFESLSADAKREAMLNLVESLPADAWGEDARSTKATKAEQSTAPATTLSVVDGKGNQVEMKPIQALSAEEMAALFPIPADAEPITELPTTNETTRPEAEKQQASSEPTVEQRKQVDQEVKQLRASLPSKQHYDGDSDSEESLIDAEEAGDPASDRKERRAWLGLGEGDVDQDAELEHGLPAEDEMDDFLDFARKALGLSEDQYDQIIRERQSRGAFVPRSTYLSSPGFDARTLATSRGPQTFEEAMDLMDSQLGKPTSAGTNESQARQSNGKGKGKEVRFTQEEEDEDSDEEMQAQDRELIEKLISSGELAGTTDASMLQVNMLQNFLESYKAQEGTAGPVSNLAGRMKIGPLPQDADG